MKRGRGAKQYGAERISKRQAQALDRLYRPIVRAAITDSRKEPREIETLEDLLDDLAL